MCLGRVYRIARPPSNGQLHEQCRVRALCPAALPLWACLLQCTHKAPRRALCAPCKGGMETGSQAPPSRSAPPPPPPPREGSGDGRGEEEEGMTLDEAMSFEEWGKPAAADAPAGKAQGGGGKMIPSPAQSDSDSLKSDSDSGQK